MKLEWEMVIGLEVHVQLNTKSKIFSGASTAYGALPNTQACVIDLGLPGVLPVLNQEVVRKAIQFGLAIQGQIAKRSIFARKNYFYPDLPKGYQISQYEHPIIEHGHLDISTPDGEKRIHIVRAHLEEDAGKSLHEDFHGMSAIDLNRAGVPLLEIVSSPDLRTPQEAVSYLKTLHTLIRYLDISDGNMQEGSFRCDANISVRPKGSESFGIRAEVKNVNSFRYVEKAILYEAQRQIALLEQGKTVVQETRLYDATLNETRSMRSKENANDYRYFPEPDLLPLVITEQDIETLRSQLPELPHEKRLRFQTQYGLTAYDSDVLTNNPSLANYYETVLKLSGSSPKLASNFITTELLGALNEANLDITQSPISETSMAMLLKRIEDKTISGKIAKTIFESLWHGENNVDALIQKLGLTQLSDPNALNEVIAQVLSENPSQWVEYLGGKDRLFGYFVGQVMQKTKGRANPEQLNQCLMEKLNERKK